MKQAETRLNLLNGAIHVIANEGLDKATTKQICYETGINEVYIYRCFKNKEDLYAHCFDWLDIELLDKLKQHVSIMSVQDMDFELKCRFFFSAIWSFMLGNRDRCITYVRYYYSEYFNKYSADDHEKRYKSFVEIMEPIFKGEADVWMILNHILDVMLNFAIKVHDNRMPSGDNYAEHVFRVIYAAIKQYFK